MKSDVSGSDIIGLVTPLYLDWLPYPVIWFLEKIAADYNDLFRGRYFFTVAQCGFLDTELMHPLHDSCHFFARAVGMEWLGSLSYPGGAIIDGTLLEDLGKRGEKITAGFKLALEDVIQWKQISPEAKNTIILKIPHFLYRPLAWYLNRNSRKRAKANGVTDLSREYYLEQ